MYPHILSMKLSKNGIHGVEVVRDAQRLEHPTDSKAQGPGRRPQSSSLQQWRLRIAFWCDSVTLHPSHFVGTICRCRSCTGSCGFVRGEVDRQLQHQVHLSTAVTPVGFLEESHYHQDVRPGSDPTATRAMTHNDLENSPELRTRVRGQCLCHTTATQV